MLCNTWGEIFEVPSGEISASASNDSSEWEPDWVTEGKTSVKRPVPQEPEGPRPSPSGPPPEPVCVERGLPPHMAAPKLGLNETMEFLSRFLGAGDEDRDLSALSAALKSKLGLTELKEPPASMSPGVELLTQDVKSYREIRSIPHGQLSKPLPSSCKDSPCGHYRGLN